MYYMSEKWNTKEFFESKERSSELRRICVEILQLIDNVLSGKILEQERPQTYSRLEQLNGALLSLGIGAKMHVGRKETDFKRNPIKAAEYIAGQAIQFTGQDMKSALELHPQIGEWSEESISVGEAETAYMQQGKVPEHIAELRSRFGMIGVLADMLDAADEVK